MSPSSPCRGGRSSWQPEAVRTGSRRDTCHKLRRELMKFAQLIRTGCPGDLAPTPTAMRDKRRLRLTAALLPAPGPALGFGSEAEAQPREAQVVLRWGLGGSMSWNGGTQ